MSGVRRKGPGRRGGKDVILSLMGMQLSDGVEPELLEMVTEGKYRKRGGAYYITFRENIMGESERATTTTLKVADGGMITLMRFGAVNNHFVFERGKKHLSHYDTALGSFTVGVTARDMEARIGDDGGDIHIGYEIEINGGDAIYNDLFMKVREPNV